MSFLPRPRHRAETIVVPVVQRPARPQHAQRWIWDGHDWSAMCCGEIRSAVAHAEHIAPPALPTMTAVLAQVSGYAQASRSTRAEISAYNALMGAN